METSNPRVVLAELYTSAADAECPEAHQAMQLLATEYRRNEVVMIAWHNGDDLTFPDGTSRAAWGSIVEYPTAVFDGVTANIGGGSSAEDVKNRYNSHIEQRIDVSSPLRMTVEWEFDTISGEGTVWVNMTAVETIRLTDLRLHTVMFEDQVGPYDGGNGEAMHDFVAREFLETQGAEGEPFSIDNGDTRRYTYDVDASYAEDLDMVGVLAFVQSHGDSPEVLQAAYVGVPVVPNQAPVLSQALLDTSMGNTEDDEVTFKVLYKDTDDTRNMGPIMAKVSYKNATSGVTEQDLVPEDETGNWYEGRMMVYTTKLGPGAYTFKFSASDGKADATGDTDWSTTPVNILPRNKLIELKDTTYAPGSGDTATMFRFEVKVRDMDDVKPSTSNIVLDGKAHEMVTEALGPWNNWVYYYYETTLSMGSHKYYFEFSDGMDDVRYPSVDAVPNYIVGPTVTAQNDIPTLTTPNHSPSEGQKSTMFEFTIVYTDAENDPPLMPRMYLDSRPCLMTAESEDYDQGVMFVYRTKLDVGEHEYYFWFYDGVNDIRHPKTGMIEGPTVANQDPEAHMQSPSMGDEFEPGELVQFRGALSRDPDGDPISFRWTSDLDGLLGTEPDFDAHLTSGMHTIELEVSDDFGGVDTVSVQVTMKAPYGNPYFEGYTVNPMKVVEDAPVIYTVTVNNKGMVEAEDQLVQFLVNDLVVGTVTVTVDVDTPVHLDFDWIFAEGGNHIVQFKTGEETLEIIQSVMSNSEPIPYPGEEEDESPIKNTQPKAGKMVHFGVNVLDPDGDPITHYWDFGDGVTSYEDSPTHEYTKPGKYTVTVVCTDCHNATQSFTKVVQVGPASEDGSDGMDMTVIVVVAIVVVVALVGVAIWRRKR